LTAQDSVDGEESQQRENVEECWNESEVVTAKCL
jgi:hypothetical protein